MSDDISKPQDEKTEPSGKDKLKATAKKTVEIADKASNAAEVANNAFGAIKWVAIAVVLLTVSSLGYCSYKAVTKPVVAVTDAAEKMVDVVGDGAGALKDSAGNIVNRLVIPTQDQSRLNILAESNFELLHKLPASKPEGIKDRLFRKTNFGDSDHQICKMSVDFGGGDLVVHAATDNEGYAKSKSLGSKDGRLIRFIIRAGKDDIPINVVWGNETKHWDIKWRPSTVKKPLDDTTAEARIFDILDTVGKQCSGS